MKLLFLGGVETKLDDQSTDSGEGGTKHVFAGAMVAKGITKYYYLICTCLLHNLQIYVCNTVQNIMREGAFDDNGDCTKISYKCCTALLYFKICKKMTS